MHLIFSMKSHPVAFVGWGGWSTIERIGADASRIAGRQTPLAWVGGRKRNKKKQRQLTKETHTFPGWCFGT
jgi:hypothetical protein